MIISNPVTVILFPFTLIASRLQIDSSFVSYVGFWPGEASTICKLLLLVGAPTTYGVSANMYQPHCDERSFS